MNIPNFPNNFHPTFNTFLQNKPQNEINQEENLDFQTEILNITKIKEGLYLGDQIAGTNLDVVIQFKLTHMINSTGKQIINAWETIGIKYLILNWEESQNQNLFDSLDEISNKIFDFIEDSFIRGEGLLVYSLKGQNRCCIVIIIYLMKKYKWPLNKCLEFLRNRKQDINIPNFFMEQLKNFERRMIKRGEGIINIPWSEDNLNSSDEKLMRNTYVNGLKNDVNNAKIIPSDLKKKKHIGWADCSNIKKCSLEIVNLNKDLFFKKDIKNIVSHIKMKPSKSCVKGNKKNNLENFNYEEEEFNKKLDGRSGSFSQVINNKFKDENNVFINIKTINNNNNQINNNMNSNNYQGNRLKNDNVDIKNNFMKNNNNTKSINNNNFDNSMPINKLNAGNIMQKENINLNNNYIKNISFSNSLQPSLQKNNIKNSNIIYNNNFNKDNDDIHSMPFSYTLMNPLQNNTMNNNNFNQKNIHNNFQQNNNLNHNDLIRNNNNFNNIYSGQQQRISSSINENNQNMINFEGNYNIGSINSLNPANIKNYLQMKENNITNNQNNNDRAKIIYAEKYEQIVNNNIQNIIINQDSNKQEMKSIKKIKTENIPYNNNIDSEIGPIPNINFNQTSTSINMINSQNDYYNNYNINNKMIKSENIKQQNKKIPKNNENQKNPINYNNFNMTKFDYKNDKILMNPELKDNKIFKVSDYTNTNLNKNNNFMNYTPINRQQEIYNNNPLMKNNFIEYNISKNQNITKPINNFNPNLMKKNQNKQNIQNTKKSNNLYNRPKSQNGPIKIKNDYSLKKPSTPDQINHIRNNNNNIIQKSKYNNLYNPINRSIYSGSKTPTRNDNNIIKNRPSTAPQKDKNNIYGNNNNFNNNKYGNIKKGINNNFSGPNKRLPSPQIHSNNILKTQKNNPRYRAPSPVIKSGNVFNNMGIGNIKRSSNVIQNKMY